MEAIGILFLFNIFINKKVIQHFNGDVLEHRTTCLQDLLVLFINMIKLLIPKEGFSEFYKICMMFSELVYKDPDPKIFKESMEFICAGSIFIFYEKT